MILTCMHLQPKKFTVKDYIKNLDAKSMTGNWKPAGAWHRIHGDCKSTTNGKWHLETMATSKGTYKVRLLEGASPLSAYALEYKTQPSFDSIVKDLKAKV